MGEMWESQIRVRTDTERSATGDSNRQLSLLVEGVIELFTGHNFNRDASNLPVNRVHTDLLLRSAPSAPPWQKLDHHQKLEASG